MPLPEAHAITIIWSNIPAEHAKAIRKWHNIENTTERLEGPGYILPCIATTEKAAMVDMDA